MRRRHPVIDVVVPVLAGTVLVCAPVSMLTAVVSLWVPNEGRTLLFSGVCAAVSLLALVILFGLYWWERRW